MGHNLLLTSPSPSTPTKPQAQKSLAISHNWNVKPAAPVSKGLLHQRFGSSCMAASFDKGHHAKIV